jgi:hypothetical protein
LVTDWKVGVWSPAGVQRFFFDTTSASILRLNNFVIQQAPETLYTGIKKTEREADHSPPTGAKITDNYAYEHFLSAHLSMVYTLIKHMKNFIFSIPLKHSGKHTHQPL